MGKMGVSVIGLHGLACSEEEVERGFELVRTYVSSPAIRWILPKARKRRVSVLEGNHALAWYDLKAYDRSELDEAGIERATQKVCDMVRAEHNQSPYGHPLVLMGFSQGGTVALNAGLRLGDEVSGIVALATALPFPDQIGPAATGSPHVFLGHGLLDQRVPYSFGRETHRVLKERGYVTELRSYFCGHTCTRRQLRDVSRWLDERFMRGASAQENSLTNAVQLASRS